VASSFSNNLGVNMLTVQQEILDDIKMGILQQGIQKGIAACYGNAKACGWWKNLEKDKIEKSSSYRKITEFLAYSGQGELVEKLDGLLPLTENMTTEQRGIGNILMLFVTEISEGYEGHRKNKMDDKLTEYKMLDVEVADLYIRLNDYMGRREEESGISFAKIIADKLTFNMTRPDHKLENRLKEDGKKL
jgi:hypothetical protein